MLAMLAACMFGVMLLRVDWKAETEKAKAAQQEEKRQQATMQRERRLIQMGEIG